MGTATILPGPYRTPAYAYDVLAVATNKPPLGAYRGVGMTMGVFVMERALDLCADRLGLDPAEIRRRNLISRDDYPFSSAAGFVYDSGDYPTALAMALDLAGYERLVRERDAARRHGRLLGVGIACYTEYTGMGGETYRAAGHGARAGPRSGHRLDRRRRQRAMFTCPFRPRAKGMPRPPLRSWRIGSACRSSRCASSSRTRTTAPPGTGTFASRGAIAQGGAVDGAARKVRVALVAIAAAALEASPADLELTGGRVSVRGVPGRGLSVADLARIAHSAAPGARPDARALEATEVFDPPGPTFSGAVHVASVEVDPETGRVTVRAYALVEDCGPVINPLIVEGQIHGAVAQGIGEALDERLVYDEEGQLLTGTLMDYALPVASALPDFAVGHLETPSPITPGGYKGMGEGGTIGAPAAIANAVADAVRPLGIAITALPILPEALRRRGAAAR